MIGAALLLSPMPEWPAEIEAECVIAPDDPYEVDADRLPSEAKAGLGLVAPEAD